MIASSSTLRHIKPLSPFKERTVINGMSYGVSLAGYDIRIKETITLPKGKFTLASSIEEFNMPTDLLGVVHDKSTWARQGIAVQNTVIEPGWKGFLTLEITNHSEDTIILQSGMPIAQVIFHYVDEDTEGYAGKYQNQKSMPVGARFE